MLGWKIKNLHGRIARIKPINGTKHQRNNSRYRLEKRRNYVIRSRRKHPKKSFHAKSISPRHGTTPSRNLQRILVRKQSSTHHHRIRHENQPLASPIPRTTSQNPPTTKQNLLCLHKRRLLSHGSFRGKDND